ncbi:MAG: peptidoglycan DD-metalloendopeptidase family protein [Coriobacteriia bacterium]|nr:peptidoglycan DD-metalloendopeptidase family protein [Coriobacteriia bacterium]
MDTTNSRYLLRKSLLHILLATLLAVSFLLLPFLQGAPTLAFAVTSAEKQAEVDEAFRRLDVLQTEINQISIDYDAAVIVHALAEANMIAAKEREEAALVRIGELQEQLGELATSMYRNGNGSYLDVLFGTQSFLEFINCVDLINRVNEQNALLIAETKEVKAEAEAARIEYTEQERVALEKQLEIGALWEEKLVTEASLLTEIAALQQVAAELLAQEEAVAEAARQYTIAYGSGSTGLANTEQWGRVYALNIRYPFANHQKVSSHFGPRSFDGFHFGTDWACPTGTPILAIADGTVAAAGSGGDMGVYVIILHGNGIRSLYMHNSNLAVSAGQSVVAGEVIALYGSTGNSTGPHLHLQIEVDKRKAVDPMSFYQGI